MEIGGAVERVLSGGRVSRIDWNCKTLYLEWIKDGTCFNGGWIGLFKDGKLVCPWTASQTDLVAVDWVVVK